MIEHVFKISRGDEKAIEKVILDENLQYIHMVFGKDEGLPVHVSNSNVYMTIVRGILTIGLDDHGDHEYAAGHVLKIPVKTQMNVRNLHNTVLELIVVKAPAPQV
jgi:quercetin dioxygenase-like cupin family protein